VIELASRKRGQDPPPWVVWEALTVPNRDPIRRWLELVDGEVAPRILGAVEPTLVVWSSLWADRPNDQIRFDLEPSGEGCSLRWTLLSPDDPPDEETVAQLRHRLNFLINGQLRQSFDY
jgi:hypothetical protein